MRVQSERAKGSVFTITLPLAGDSHPASVARSMSEPSWILLVEDNEANGMLACAVLERAGLDVRWARTPQAARELLVGERPALILMDMKLPGLDGMSFTRQLKADPATSSIPIVAVTAHAMEGYRELVVEAGCAGYISKPINVLLFATLVRGYMAESETAVAHPAPLRGR